MSCTALGFGLKASAVDEYLFSWEDPSGARFTHERVTPDENGQARAHLHHELGDPQGTWTVRVLECSEAFESDGRCPGTEVQIDELALTVGNLAAVAGLSTHLPAYQTDGDDVRVQARLENAGSTALVEQSAVVYVVLTPSGDEYLRSDGTFAPYTGAQVTRVLAPVDLNPGAGFLDEFTISDVSFPVSGQDFQVFASWYLPCGELLDESLTTFEVAPDPCPGADTDSDGLDGTCDNLSR